VAEDRQTLQAMASGDHASADYVFSLPLTTLAAGEYLLSVDVLVGDTSAQRRARFIVEGR
jgi:hypothetical protein